MQMSFVENRNLYHVQKKVKE